MGLLINKWISLMCFCAIGIQLSYQFIAEQREMRDACRLDGGYCINIHPRPTTTPFPPPRRAPARSRGAHAGARGRAGLPATSTRKGRRPDPRAVAAKHTRLPASAQNAQPAYDPYMPPPMNNPRSPAPQQQVQNGGWFFGTQQGTGSQNPMMDPFMMFAGMRKKRQAAGEPIEHPPLRRHGQSMFDYLNGHCRKTDYQYTCRSTGGICCLPFL